MAKLTISDVNHVAKLSNLSLTEAEANLFANQLSEVVDYISSLQEIDAAGVTPTSQTTGLVNITREDEINVERILSPEKALLNAKNYHNNYFQVPPVLTKDQ